MCPPKTPTNFARAQQLSDRPCRAIAKLGASHVSEYRGNPWNCTTLLDVRVFFFFFLSITVETEKLFYYAYVPTVVEVSSSGIIGGGGRADGVKTGARLAAAGNEEKPRACRAHSEWKRNRQRAAAQKRHADCDRIFLILSHSLSSRYLSLSLCVYMYISSGTHPIHAVTRRQILSYSACNTHSRVRLLCLRAGRPPVGRRRVHASFSHRLLRPIVSYCLYPYTCIRAHKYVRVCRPEEFPIHAALARGSLKTRTIHKHIGVSTYSAQILRDTLMTLRRRGRVKWIECDQRLRFPPPRPSVTHYWSSKKKKFSSLKFTKLRQVSGSQAGPAENYP